MTSLRFLLIASLALAPFRAQQEEAIFVDDTLPKDFLSKIQRCEESKDWRTLFHSEQGLYTQALRRYASKVVPLQASGARGAGTETGRWTSMSEFLIRRLSRLPKEAYEYYRLECDGRARAAFQKAREEGDRRAIEKAVSDFFFSSLADDNLDYLARLCLEEGRADEALFYWSRLLRVYPDSEIPKAVTAAHVAHACVMTGNEAGLDDLRDHVKSEGIDGKIVVGGVIRELGTFLGGLTIPSKVAAVRSPRLPAVQEPEDRYKRRVIGVRNDIRRWTYDFATDRGEAAGQGKPPPQPGMRIFRVRGGEAQQAAPPLGEFPYFPAYARVRGKEYVIFTNGARVVAFDPSRARGNASVDKGDSCIYWRYPHDKPLSRPAGNPQQYNYVCSLPYIGVTVDGEYAYATMISPSKPRDNNPNNYDSFEGTTALKCFHIPSGKLVWDTDDDKIRGDYKKLEFHDRNFSFSSAPLVKEGRLYVGICTSPFGEQESRVLCIDKKTGRLLWSTFVASVTGARNMWDGRGMVIYQTMLAEQGGIVYVHTNLGIMGALNGVTGHILWLTQYRRSMQRNQWNMNETRLIRPANWPVVYKDRVYILPQDKEELQGFDKLSGQPVDLPPVRTRETDPQFPWKNATHLIGMVDDWMLVGGSTSHVVRMKDFQAYSLASSNTQRCGRGAIDGDLIYLPALNQAPNANNVGVLAVYHGVGSWKSLDQPAWKEAGAYGNLLLAGDFLIVATDKITVYTDVETLRNEFTHRIYQSPPHVESLLEYGDTMLDNDRFEEAGEAYLAFTRAAEADPAYGEKIKEVRGRLHSIFLRRGEEASSRGDEGKALEFYGLAKRFAFDEKTEAEATKRLAQTHEKLRHWKDAVGQYQELIQKARDQYERQGESVMKMREYARKRIDEIIAKMPEAYEEVEKQAVEALKKAKSESAEALRDVFDRFPNAKSVRDIWSKMYDAYKKQGKLEKLPSLYREMKEWFKEELDPEMQKKLFELLEKLGDDRRLMFELEKARDRSDPGATAELKEYCERRLQDLARRPRPEGALRADLKKQAEFEPVKAPSDPHGLAVTFMPLRPLGIEPPGMGGHIEIFERGSSVELWDLKENRRVWTCPHPGAYLGIAFTDAAPADAGVGVAGVKEGSPAEKIGLAQGDLVVMLDGRPVRADSFTARLATTRPGSPVEIRWRRGGQEMKAQVEPAPHPFHLRPGIVGASFTRDYALAVAWEDLVASIDLATGKAQWTFRDVRDRFHIRGFHATDGRLYAAETWRPDRDRDPFRTHGPRGQQERQAFQPEDAHHRLLCLNDFTGDVAWARAFDFDPATAPQQASQGQITFAGDYLSDNVIFFESNLRAGVPGSVLWVLNGGDGTSLKKHVLPAQTLAQAIDAKSGVLYYVEASPEQGQRHLRSLSLDPSRKHAAWQVPLLAKYMPQNYAACALTANKDYVCLLVLPNPPTMVEGRIWVFTPDGKEYRSEVLPEARIKLPEDRSLPSWICYAKAVLDDEGRLYVYTVPRERSGVGTTGRAWLTAFRVGAKSESELTAWDGVAPVMNAQSGATGWLMTEPRGVVVFSSPRAASPGQSAEVGTAVVYDNNDGYIAMARTDLSAPTDVFGGAESPAVYWRGRLYLNGKQGLQVYGN